MIAETGCVVEYGVNCSDVDATGVRLIGDRLGGGVGVVRCVGDKGVKNVVMW